MFGNNNTMKSMFTREMVNKQLPPVIPIVEENIIQKNQTRNDMKAQQFKKEKAKIPGMALLKKINKKSKKTVINSDSDSHSDSDNNDDDNEDENEEIERYAKSIKKVIKIFT